MPVTSADNQLTDSFPDDSPDPLVRMQQEHWDPLFQWLKEEYGVTLAVAEGFSPARQSEADIQKLRSVVEGMDHWELACESSACIQRRATGCVGETLRRPSCECKGDWLDR